MAHPQGSESIGSELAIMNEAETSALGLDTSVPFRFLTWNPKPRYIDHQKFTPNNYNLQWYTMLLTLISVMQRACSMYCFIPEIGENGKLHCHGWFLVKDMVKFHKSFLPTLRRKGFVKIDKISKLSNKSFDYYKKDLVETKRFLEDFEIIAVSHDNVDRIKLRLQQLQLKHLNTMLNQTKEECRLIRLDIMDSLYRHGLLKSPETDSDNE